MKEVRLMPKRINQVRLEVRQALPSELSAVVKLLADDPLGALRERPGKPLERQYVEAFADMRSQTGNELLVALLGEELVGCLQLILIPGISRLGAKRGQIEGVRVSRHHRGTGIGKALICYAIEYARTNGCSLIQLTTDRARPEALRFYEELGFVPSHIGLKLTL
jgi:GNAT superfamily N-acetyltransferase